MPRRFGKRATKIEGQFAARTIDMLRSPAMALLSLSGRRMLDRLEIELAQHGGLENGRLPVTYEHFVEFGIDRDSIAPAIRELEALGFIEITEHGAAGNREFRRPNLFRLTYKHTDRAGATDEWKAIATKEEAARLARQARLSKTNFSRGSSEFSVGKTPTETNVLPIGVSRTTAPVGVSPTTSISRGGEANGATPPPSAYIPDPRRPRPARRRTARLL